MLSIRTRVLSSAAFLLGFAQLAVGEGVRILTPSGNSNYSSIQAAVNAAQDGDVLLVGGGDYSAFTIVDKSISVVAVPGALVEVRGPVEVKSLAVGRTVLLAGLSVNAFVLGATPPALSLRDNSGQVRIQGCTFTGAGGNGFLWNGQMFEGRAGGLGAELQNNLQVAIVGTTFRGGVGYGHSRFCDSKGGDGGDGVKFQGTAAALYDCQLLGGAGGSLDSLFGGHGGRGARVLDYGIFSSGSTFRGGNGGFTGGWINTGPSTGGNGGDGLTVDAGQAQLLGNSLQGGASGFGANGGPHGIFGLPTSGVGVINVFSGTARKFALAATITGDQTSLGMTVSGAAGDAAFVVQSQLPGWRLLTPTTPGVILVQEPWMSELVPLGIVPGSGTLPLSIATGDLPFSAPLRQSYLQGYVTTSTGGFVLGSPMHLITIDRNSPPDCDGNGVNDFVDALVGASDCNGNLIPDACDPDLNGNGIPDECEPFLYVDAAAALGGNGTPGAPFRTIREGIVASIGGDTVVVRDGIYFGPDNRNLTFLNKNIVVRSENGPASCIIDCQLLDRAFKIDQAEPPTARIEGFTIRNGNAGQNRGGAVYVGGIARPTISNCVIRGCLARDGGGACAYESSFAAIENCTFLDNQAALLGGGVYVATGSTVIRNCSFVGNQSNQRGGGLFASGNSVIANCEFRENRSQYGGGFGTFTGATLQIQNCVFAGNLATSDGGGLHAYPSIIGGAVRLSHVTMLKNSAQRGGGYWSDGGATLHAANSILWDNDAPLGAQIGTGSLLAPGTVAVSYCDVRGAQAGVHFAGGTLNWGAGNLDVDPQFIDVGLRLSAFSPCVDAGNNLAVPADAADLDGDGNVTEQLPLDLDFGPRFVDVPTAPDTGNGTSPFVDMGPYERGP